MSEISGNSTITSDGCSPVEMEESVNSAFYCRGFSSEPGRNCTIDGLGQDDAEGESNASLDRQGQAAKDEKILVTVRLRPLNAKEIANHDFSIWDCPDNKTVTCLYSRSDRSNFPHTYIFDQVFKAETTTKEVYERGAKDVTLSALTGKNATVFAYGQTCSGKTYTMNGITEHAADDIFDHIKQHDDYVFLVKFSALEIYNEVVSDLLKSKSPPLRIMDDRERGTVIERLREETIKDKDHLRGFLAICEARRQVGETALNDISSRSHQIIRLTIESSPRAAMTAEGPIKSLIAVLNFVDLAGSERVSLTHSEGTTLKEGCYINRSLLTLSSVIRKLSDPNRSKAAHIPYRESKLTRILRNALGGNARTAIICTMSSSNSHLEQTRNTLFFASYAKEVTNRAQVNVVVSDKDIIKQLKKEVALLEAQLRRASISSQNSFDALLQEKELQIQRMQDEMDKALERRDSAESQLNDFRKQMKQANQGSNHGFTFQGPPLSSQADGQFPGITVETNGHHRNLASFESSFDGNHGNGSLRRLCNGGNPPVPQTQATSASSILLEEIYKLEHLQNELAQDANRALEAVQKEVECLCLTQTDMNQEAAMSVAKLQSEINEIYESRMIGASVKGAPLIKENDEFYSLKEEIQRVVSKDVMKVGDADIIGMMPAHMQIKIGGLGVSAPVSEQQSIVIKECDDRETNGQVGLKSDITVNTDMKSQAEESIRSMYAIVSDMKERMSKLQYQKQLLVNRVLELERNGNADEEAAMSAPTSSEQWRSEFQVKQKQIFELWDACHVSIIHRSQFYLLFRGDPADAIYMEVELRRLNWLRQNHCTENSSRLAGYGHSEQVASPITSMRALKRERELIMKYLSSRLNFIEREELYRQWGVPLSAKQRRQKLANMVWTNFRDEGHVKMSAELVASLMPLWNRSRPVSKEMFQLSLSAPGSEKQWFSWSPMFPLFGLRNTRR